MKSRRPARRHGAFTMIEMLIVMGIIVVLLGILLPVFGIARARSRQTRCANNLRMIGQGIFLHEQTYKRLPPRKQTDQKTWELMRALGSELMPWEAAVLETRAITAANLSCPVLEAGDLNPAHLAFGLSYAMNRYDAGGVLSRASGNTILVAEVNPHLGLEYVGPDASALGLLSTRHSHMGNWLFFDGHVELLGPSEAIGTHGAAWGANQGQLISMRWRTGN